MTRMRRFENLEKTRPGDSEGPAPSRGVSGRFGSTQEATPGVAPEPAPPSHAMPERFGDAPAGGAALRVREPDEGQPFVRCASCRADGHVTSVVCSHCGADLSTREQRAYNESVWRQQQAERAEQREQLAKQEAARAQADREAAEAHRRLDEMIDRSRSRYSRSWGDHRPDPVAEAARALGAWLGAWLRRAVPERRQWIALVVLAGVALVGLVAAFPWPAWRVLGFLGLAAAVFGWHRRLTRPWRR